MTFSAVDHAFMARALQLAARGLYSTTPNPRVGCVLVGSGGEVIAEAWHERAGEPHAEVLALQAAGPRALGATAYVTLEPCAHFGRTPPCADALIHAGVSRVVIAMLDPNPLVSGKGIARLQAAGIDTTTGLLETDAQELNIGFVSRMTRGKPWMRLKIASSLDGRSALSSGVSQWITGEAARRDGHRWRARACAILTGIGTVRQDDPQLNVRAVPCSRQPLKILVDARLEVPTHARLLDDGHCLIATANPDPVAHARLAELGAEVIVLADQNGKVDLPALIQALGQRGLNEVHVEAGFKLNGSLIRNQCIDECLIYQAPLLLGDATQGMFNLAEPASLAEGLRLEVRDVRLLGQDLRILARPEYNKNADGKSPDDQC